MGNSGGEGLVLSKADPENYGSVSRSKDDKRIPREVDYRYSREPLVMIILARVCVLMKESSLPLL